ARPLVEVIDVLRDEREALAQGFLESSEGGVRGVRRDFEELAPASVVEVEDAARVPRVRLGRGDVLDSVLLPQAAGGPERRDAALGGDAGAGEDRDAAGHADGASNGVRGDGQGGSRNGR